MSNQSEGFYLREQEMIERARWSDPEDIRIGYDYLELIPYINECDEDYLPTHWRTKDGQVIAIHDMTDSHLNNSIAFLANKSEEHRYGRSMRALELERERRSKL